MRYFIFLKNVDHIFVQNIVMQDLLIGLGYSEKNIRVIPYKNVDMVKFSGVRIKESFIYVASGDAHKNHLNLISAWIILSKENIYPTLFLTIAYLYYKYASKEKDIILNDNNNIKHIINKQNETDRLIKTLLVKLTKFMKYNK